MPYVDKMVTCYKHIHPDGVTESPITRDGRWWNWTDTYIMEDGTTRESSAQSSHLSSVKDQIEFKGGQFVTFKAMRSVYVKQDDGLGILRNMLKF